VSLAFTDAFFERGADRFGMTRSGWEEIGKLGFAELQRQRRKRKQKQKKEISHTPHKTRIGSE
jgi:hypothetical protein